MMSHARGRLFAAVSLALLVLGVAPVRASTPPSQDVTAPTHPGQSARADWSGTVGAGAQAGSECTDAPVFDEHTINLTVPAGTYTGLTIRGAFTLTPPQSADMILMVTGPDDFSATADNNGPGGTEMVSLNDPSPGTYVARACAFAGSAVSYAASFTMKAATAGVCGSDLVNGIDLQTATIPDLQAAMANGTLTSHALVEAYLQRIKTYDPKLDAIRALNPHALADADALDAERASKGSRGPLHGIPILLKDNVNTTDMPTTAGSIALEGSIPFHEATLVTKLRAAGAIILGKTNLSEFAGWVSLMNPPGYSSLGGQVRNAYHFGDPSGSSSGSGVAASMAFAAATIGTETSGSILSPSYVNSAVGIKTTVGLVSRDGVIPLSPTFDTPGPITRSVTDAAIVLGAIAGVDARDAATAASADGFHSDYRPYLNASGLNGKRIGVADADRDGLSAAEQKRWDRVITVMEKLGVTIVHDDQLANDRAIGNVELGVIPNEFKASLNDYLAAETPDTLRVRTLKDIEDYNNAHADKFPNGQNLITASDLTLGNMDTPDAVAGRTATITAARGVIDKMFADDNLDAFMTPKAIDANIGAAAQYPSIAVPAGYVRDLPFGISLLGKPYSEPLLIGIGYAYEHATHLRTRPTKINRGLCPLVKTAVLGAHHTKPARGSLPATGSEDALVWGVLLGALALALVARERLSSRT